jgi:hypothetical protein
MTPSSVSIPTAALRDLRAERGYSLIVAVSIVALLIMVGSMVLEQVYADTQLSGSERAAQNALYVADAGAVWGQMKLSNMVFPGGLDSASTAAPILSGLMALPPLPAGDAMCPDLSATACSQWFLLSPGPLPGWVAYGTNSNYRVAATCNPQPCSNSNTPINYSVRSMSVANDGARRLVETVIGP